MAWEPLGWEPAWFAEIEPFPSAVLAHHWPTVPNLGDMTLIHNGIADGRIEAPDVLVGGTPCQAFSITGLRSSLEDTRGQLTLHFVGLANAIDTARQLRNEPPAVVVWENVPGVLTTPDNAFGCFLGALAGEDVALLPPGGKWTNAGVVVGPARTIAWRVLDAQYFGVAQRRRRVFVVASARDGFCPDEVLFEFDGMRRDSPPRRETRQDLAPVAGTLAANDGGTTRPAGNCNELDFCVPVAPALTASGRGVERCGETRGQDPVVAVFGGNRTGGPIEVAPALNACGTASGRQDFETEAFVAGPCATGDVFHTLRGEGFDASEDGTGRGAGAIAVAHVEILPTTTSGGPKDTSHAQISGQMRDAYIVPVLGFNARQDPDSWEERVGPLDTDPGTQAVGVLAIRGRADGSSLEARYDGTANAILTPSGGRAGIGVGAVHTGMQVRRIMPTECERLQGFPDGHTLIPWPVVRDVGIHPCRKRVVRATVRTPAGSYFVATNHLSMDPGVCPRAEYPTGQGYDLCASVCGQQAHAEIRALVLAGKKAKGATLYVEGHTYACEDCLRAARNAGIVEVVLGPPPAESCPDGPRYKALGNSMCVAVMHWIGARIHQQAGAQP